jgi:hypothetical protein
MPMAQRASFAVANAQASQPASRPPIPQENSIAKQPKEGKSRGRSLHPREPPELRRPAERLRDEQRRRRERDDRLVVRRGLVLRGPRKRCAEEGQQQPKQPQRQPKVHCRSRTGLKKKHERQEKKKKKKKKHAQQTIIITPQPSLGIKYIHCESMVGCSQRKNEKRRKETK